MANAFCPRDHSESESVQALADEEPASVLLLGIAQGTLLYKTTTRIENYPADRDAKYMYKIYAEAAIALRRYLQEQTTDGGAAFGRQPFHGGNLARMPPDQPNQENGSLLHNDDDNNVESGAPSSVNNPPDSTNASNDHAPFSMIDDDDDMPLNKEVKIGQGKSLFVPVQPTRRLVGDGVAADVVRQGIQQAIQHFDDRVKRLDAGGDHDHTTTRAVLSAEIPSPAPSYQSGTSSDMFEDHTTCVVSATGIPSSAASYQSGYSSDGSISVNTYTCTGGGACNIEGAKQASKLAALINEDKKQAKLAARLAAARSEQDGDEEIDSSRTPDAANEVGSGGAGQQRSAGGVDAIAPNLAAATNATTSVVPGRINCETSFQEVAAAEDHGSRPLPLPTEVVLGNS